MLKRFLLLSPVFIVTKRLWVPKICSYAAGVSTIKRVATILSLGDIFNYASIVNCFGYLKFIVVKYINVCSKSLQLFYSSFDEYSLFIHDELCRNDL